MAPINQPTKMRSFALAAALFFLALSWIGWAKGQEGKWHDRCVEFWKKREWMELKNLAQNLDLAGTSNAEALFFGMLAAHQSHDISITKDLGEKLLNSHVLNLKMETNTASVLKPTSPVVYLKLFRTRSVILLWSALAFAQFMYVSGRTRAVLWILFLSSFGVFLLLI